MENFDCVVVGAGWYGLGAAKQYHCTNPQASLAIFDSGSDLGGTWSAPRIYPGLKSNNLLGTFEYPDFPMDTATFGVHTDEHVPGQVVNAYMHAYAKKFGFEDLIRLNTKVNVAEHQDESGGWILTVSGPEGEEYKVFARRLILATGVTSEPFLPHFEGQEEFGGKIFHGKDFLQNKDTIKPGSTVTVFGGGKTSFDAVYEYATAGVKVNWVIRSSGHGPVWISPSYVTPLKKWIENLANIRFLTWFSPSIWGSADGYHTIRRFLHGSAIGRAIVNGFWSVLGADVLAQNGYDSHPDTAKLKPWLGAMYIGTSWSIFTYETDFWDVIKGDNVSVYTGDFDHLSPGKVHLTDGTELPSDALLAHGGWNHVPPMKFLPAGIESDLGIPHAVASSPDDLAHEDSLAQADRDILQQFPRLRDEPVWNKNYVPMTSQRGIASTDAVTPYSELTPWMLCRFITPASERFLRHRDTVFIGMVGNFSNIITAHVQGLWASAFFSGRLVRDPGAAVGDDEAMGRMRHETALHNRFGKWRYPVDWGNKTPSFIFDAVPYLDMLLADLGVESHRMGGWWREIWTPYMPPDYRTVNEEWEAKFGGEKYSD